MSVTVERLEKNMAKLTITVEAAKIEEAMQEVYLKNRSKYSLPGFRKGKVSRSQLERTYGKGIFLEDAVNEVLPEAYFTAAAESGLEIVSEPKLSFDQVEVAKDLIFTAEVAVKPEVKLGEYKGVEVPKADVEVTEEDVLKIIRREQDKNAVIKPVEDRAVVDGDIATIDFEGFVDGVAFAGGKGEDYPLTIGSNTFIPGFEEQIIGKEIGKEFDVNVTFPEDYQADELAGKESVFKVTVKKIEAKELPELTDEFASEVSEFETLAEYKEHVAKTEAEKKQIEAEQKKMTAAILKATENAEMEIPDAMVDYEASLKINEMKQNLAQQGLQWEQYLSYFNQTEEQIKEQQKPSALQSIQTRLVLSAIAEAEGFEITDEEKEAEYQRLADQYQLPIDEIKPMVNEDMMVEDLKLAKARDLVVAEAKEV